jgi:hypothetical protein
MPAVWRKSAGHLHFRVIARKRTTMVRIIATALALFFTNAALADDWKE